MDDAPTQLLEVATGTAADAVVRARLSVEVVLATEALWKPVRATIPGAEHAHWDWRAKVGRLTLPGARILGVECRGAIEGMTLLLERDKFARLAPVTGLPLVYVDYLEAAPWNLRPFAPAPRFRGIGQALMAAASRLSESLGYEGRVGLHALEQAEDYYTRACQMTALGPDREYYDLWYLEWTSEVARRFVREVSR